MSKSTDGMVDGVEVPSDGELVRAVRRGDLAAFETLLRRYQRPAAAIAYRLLSHRDDAMEVTQDAFLKAFERLGSLSQPERFKSWFLRIVSNLALNRRRSRALRKMVSLDAGVGDDDEQARLDRPDTRTPTPQEIATAADLQRLIAEEIDALPEMQRQALVFFCIEKMPQKQVAEILNCTVEMVKWHVFTARKKLKEKLGDYL